MEDEADIKPIDINSKKGKRLSSRKLRTSIRHKEINKIEEEEDEDLVTGYQQSAVVYQQKTTDDEETYGSCGCACTSRKRHRKQQHLIYGRTSAKQGNIRRSKLQKLCWQLRLFCCCKRVRSNYDLTERNGRTIESDINLLYEDEPFRKRLCRTCLTFIYISLAAVAVFATYSMVSDLVISVRHPVRSIHYKQTNEYDAPGIVVYPGGADFLACGHYYNNVVTSKVRLSQLDLVNRNCSYTSLNYRDPHYNTTSRDVIIFSGPTSFTQREAIFLHFSLEDQTRDFFTVSYFVFNNYNGFANSTEPEQVEMLLDYHRYVPTFALSAGLRMWIKLIMSETFLMDGTRHTNFDVEYSVVRFHDRRPENETHKHLFFIFFEWKNNIVEQSTLLYTTTPWSVLAGLCGVFLMLHRFYVLAQTSYKRVQKDKRRRTLRKETLKKLRESRSSQRTDGSCSEGPVFL